MKILVAGGAGYIGSTLCPLLADRGYEVDVVDLLWFGNHLPTSVQLIKRNLLELKEDDLKKYDIVIFIAGLSNDPMAEFSPAQNFIFNAAHPVELAFMAKRAGVKRFIHGGSCSVYGYTVNELYDESSPTISNYPYGISKLQGEFGCLKLNDDNFSVIAFRQGTVCGYSPRMRLDLVMNTMFKSAIECGEITVNNPSIWRPVLSVRDAATAYVRAIESPAGISGVFNISSGNYTIGELADIVKDGLENKMNKKIKINIKNIQDFRNYKVDCSKAKNILGFKSRHDANSIVNDLVENLGSFNDFENDHYYNIRTFKKLAIN